MYGVRQVLPLQAVTQVSLADTHGGVRDPLFPAPPPPQSHPRYSGSEDSRGEGEGRPAEIPTSLPTEALNRGPSLQASNGFLAQLTLISSSTVTLMDTNYILHASGFLDPSPSFSF